MYDNAYNNNLQEEQGADFKQIFSVIWGLKWWMIIAAVICLVIGLCYIEISRTQYSSSAKIMLVNKDNIGSAEVAMLSDITGMSKTNKAINEIEVLRSNALMQRVVEELGLNYTYIKSRKIKPIYYDLGQSPLELIYNDRPGNPAPAKMHVVLMPKDSIYYRIISLKVDDSEYPLEGNVYKYGQEVRLMKDKFYIEANLATINYGEKYEILTTDSFSKARAMKHSLIVTTGKTMDRSDIIDLEYSDFLPKRCEAVLNSLIFQYNEDARNFRNKATSNTLSFLEERLSYIEEDLSSIEGKYQSYRRDNILVDVDSQSQITLTTDEKYEAQLTQVMLQIELLGIVRDYINQMKSGKAVIPANIGISDPGLNSTINQFNTLLLERNRMASSSSDSNPLVVTADAQIEELLASIDASVRNLERSYKIQRDNINKKLSEGRRKISNIPTQQLALSNFSRQQQIKEPLYILLQQKREEAMIALSSVTDQCKIVDDATGTAYQTAPNEKMILLLSLLLGLCIPPAIFFSRQLLKTTIDGKSDVTSRTQLPVLASIPLAEGKDILIKANGREPFEEAIRVLRSQFRYFPHKVYQVLSSSPGEGKTFISSNISTALAHAGKKVLLVGVDLRKPRLYKFFNDAGSDANRGIVSYLIGRTDSIEELIVKRCGGIANLDVIYAGAVPPNPSELIESERMKKFMDEVRGMDYDYVILDSCPFLPVADSTIINDYVDANLFVMRSGHTALKFVNELDDLSRNGNLKNVSLVLNGVDVKKRSYGYYNGYGYGHYGYGKGSGSGYGYGYGKSSKRAADAAS